MDNTRDTESKNLLLEKDAQLSKDFEITPMHALQKHSTMFRIGTSIFITLYCIVIFALVAIYEIPYLYIGLLLVVNLVTIILCGNYVLRAVIFPYANFFIKKQLDASLNKRFGEEYSKLLTSMVQHIKIMANLSPKLDETSADNEIISTPKFKHLSQNEITDINSKMMTICELIHLYAEINQEILQKAGQRMNRHFIRITQVLVKLQEVLAKITTLSTSLTGVQKDSSQPLSVWDFYRKDAMTELEIDAIVRSKLLPEIPLTASNLKVITETEQLVDDFISIVARATSTRCLCKYNKLFGTIEQNIILLKKNSEAQHFNVPSYNGTNIDCMFFPCTNEINVETQNPSGRYLDKPTIIMCNPNALLYQQMVTSPNAYWLNFFTKRDINVMCWNYRGYGLSNTKYFESINPYLCKIDAEKVLEFMVNELKLRGKIGVYGRSLGGISSCHLASKYPQVIKALIVDRTFGDLEFLSQKRLIGWPTLYIFKIISMCWVTSNDRNFAEVSSNPYPNPCQTQAKCFKILTCDDKDDVVENYSSLSSGVANYTAKTDYLAPKWIKFFNALKLVYDLEAMLHERITDIDEMEVNFRLQKGVDESENTTDDILIESQDKELDLTSTHTHFGPRYLKRKMRTTKEVALFYQYLHMIVLLLNDLKPGNIKLQEVVGLHKPRSPQEFKTFMEVLEVYGCGYSADVDKHRYRERSSTTHAQTAATELEQICQVYLMALRKFNNVQLAAFSGDFIFKRQLSSLLNYQYQCFKQLIEMQESNSVLTDYDKQVQGHLVMLTCGHKGRPNRQEEKRISRLLRKSGFIPMLDQIPPIIPQTPSKKLTAQVEEDHSFLQFNYQRPLEKIQSIHNKRQQLVCANSNQEIQDLKKSKEKLKATAHFPEGLNGLGIKDNEITPTFEEL